MYCISLFANIHLSHLAKKYLHWNGLRLKTYQASLKCLNQCFLGETRPRGHKTFFMLNSTEYNISTAHKN